MDCRGNSDCERDLLKKYNVIYADPPWETRYCPMSMGARSKKLEYPTMTDTEIIALPVQDIAADDAMLFMWCIDSRFPLLPEIMRAWGFEFKSMGFVWVKKAATTAGTNATFSSYTRRSCEFCFIGTRGRYIVKNKSIEQLVVEPKRAHSQKPETVMKRIVSMVGDVPRVELFAREKTYGWDCWGNQVESTIEIGGRNA